MLKALGLDNVDWDIPPTEAFLNNIFKQVDALNAQDDYTMALPCKPTDISLVTECLSNRGFVNITYVYWHKTSHNTPTPNLKYTSSVEVIVLAFKRTIQRCYVNLDSDPTKRHNFFEMRAVTARLKDEDGKDCNPTEKPWELAEGLATCHCAPGDAVLVIGAGAGGDMFGAASAGRRVIAVEKDERQFRILCKQMSHIAEQQKKANLKEFGKEDVKEQVINPTCPEGVPLDQANADRIVCVYCGEHAGYEGDGKDREWCVTCGEGFYYCDKSPCSFTVDGSKFCSNHKSSSSNSSQESTVPETQLDPSQDFSSGYGGSSSSIGF